MSPFAMVLGLVFLTEAQRPQMTVVWCDQMNIDAMEWKIAKAESTRIFSEAGVNLQWFETDRSRKDCRIPAGLSRPFVVVLTPQSPEGWTRPDAMGFSPEHTGRTYIFYNLVKRFIASFNVPRTEKEAIGTVVGIAIVHELGHALIPGDAHGPGIMEANWTYAEWHQALAGTLLFNIDHARAIREVLSREP